MILTLLVMLALLVSALITGFIKKSVYSDYTDTYTDDSKDEEITISLFFTALGVIIISNLIPFMLGALIGIYAII